jgi:hypothetical protein
MVDLATFVSEWKMKDPHKPVSLEEFMKECPSSDMEEVIYELEEHDYVVDRFGGTFEMSMELYMDTFDINETVSPSVSVKDLLTCTNESDLASTLPNFKPGTRYKIYTSTEYEIQKLGEIVNSDDSTLCRCFFDVRDNTAYLCFKGIDRAMFKKTYAFMRQMVREKNRIFLEMFEDEVEDMATKFVEKCLYF